MGMGRKPAGMGRGWGQTVRGWGEDGDDLLVAGRGWGRDCLPTSLSTLIPVPELIVIESKYESMSFGIKSFINTTVEIAAAVLFGVRVVHNLNGLFNVDTLSQFILVKKSHS